MPDEPQAPKRPLGSVNIEPMPEEMYSDLLPYEMEMVEHMIEIGWPADKDIPATLTAADREYSVRKIAEIRENVAKAKADGKNAWGHAWRPTPTVYDKIYEKAVEEFRASKDPPEDDDNIPATD